MDFNKENYKKVYLLAKKAKANDANALAELNQLGFEDLKSAVAWVWDCKKSEEQPEATDAPVFDNSIKLTEDKDEEEVEEQPEEEVTAEDVAEEDPATGDITVDTEEITAEPVEVAEPTEEEQDQGIASVLTQAIQDKWANVDKYNSYITTIQDDANAADLVKTLKDIVTDETIHAGLLSKALAEFNPEVADGLDKEATEHSEEELKEIETEEPVEEEQEEVKESLQESIEYVPNDEKFEGEVKEEKPVENSKWEAYNKYAEGKKAGRIARYRHLAGLKDDDIITKDNIDKWAFNKTCCEGNIDAVELEEELLGK